jgi:hypothetical protein
MSTVALGVAGGLLTLGASASIALAAAAPAGPPKPVPPPDPARIAKAAALPDWSGFWAPVQGDVFDAKTATSAAGAVANPPYNKEWAAKYAATRAKLKTDPKIDPLQACLPLGLTRMMAIAGGHYEFTILPEQVWIFSGSPAGPKSTAVQTRRIYTDGRANLSGDDLFPQYTGNSVGHWEGDTLVVHTVGLNTDESWVDRTGAQLSGDAVIDERIRMVNPNLIEDRFTITDKTALTRPWTVTRTYRRIPGQPLIQDDSCLGKRVNPADLTDAAVRDRAKAGK